MKKSCHIFLLLLSFCAMGILLFLEYTQLEKSGQYNLAILNSKVDVYFDENGIPHIEGENTNDVYRALGYITASERLFQMDTLRRLINGSLSEVYGKKTLAADKMLRTLGFKHTAQKYLTQYKNSQEFNPKLMEQVKAYLEGVHYYMDNSILPIEFQLLDYRPEYFEVEDIMGLSGYMALTFAEGVTSDILISEMMEKLPESKIQVIRKGIAAEKHYQAQDDIVKTSIINNIQDAIDVIQNYVPLFHGSNSWVLSGKRTYSGKPILANDPHIGTSTPHIFFEAHLKTPEIEVYGHYIPLSPFAIIGHTPHSAWGMTMAQVDDLTIYLEKTDPENPNKVMFNNEWVDLESREEIIKVKDSEVYKFQVKNSSHGPLLDTTKYGVSGKSLSLSWSVYHPENHILNSLYALPRAKTIEDLRQAVSYAAAPGLNITWVNKQGDIAWWMMGKFPRLPKGVPYDIVLNGWDGEHEIEGYYSVDENPHEINPESGVIISANFKPENEKYDHFDGYWQPGGRLLRLKKLLAKKSTWTMEEMKKIQLDNLVPIYDKVRSQQLMALDQTKLTPFELKVLNEYLIWDGLSSKESTGASIYHMWNYYLMYNIFSDELGVQGFKNFGKTAELWHSFKELLFQQSNPFWDNIHTDHVESAQEIMTKTFKQAVANLKERLGHKLSQWNWGKLHKAEYKHALGRRSPLNYIFNIGPIEANGGRYTINNLAHKKSTNNFEVVHAPATRRIIDMANIEYSWGILPTGNSGSPLSKHYDDQLELYHKGEYRYQLMDWKRIKKLPRLRFSN